MQHTPYDDTRDPVRRRRHARALGTVLVVAVLTGACSASGEPTTSASPTTSGPEAAAFAFSACMREQGVDDFPDPTIEDDGAVLPGLDALDVPEDLLSAAREACQRILDEGLADAAPVGDPAATWQEVAGEGETACADGSPYSYYVREADPARVVLFLDGGGACWDSGTCSGREGGYQSSVAPPNDEGVLDAADERNPLAEFSAVYAPYCTADVHLGDAVTEYADGPTVYHRGYANASAAIDHLIATFPEASQVVVVGVSAGSVAAPVYATFLADRLPGAAVTVLADSSGGYPDAPELNAVLAGDAWGADRALTDWAAITGTDGPWSFPALFAASGQHDPSIVFARIDHAQDSVQAASLALVGLPTEDLSGRLTETEALIEAAGTDLASYVTPGDEHLFLDGDDFYSTTAGGTALVDWVGDLVSGNRVDDVR
jgi:hypothetical protein